jgi:hypothetical protein
MESKLMEQAVMQAKTKLQRHKELGANSSLNILEVAYLMDLVTFGPQEMMHQSKTIFFSYNVN